MTYPWLESKQRRWMHSPKNKGVYDIHVNQLILVGGDCDWYSVCSTFNSVQEDKFIRDEDQNYCYSVKFGYNLI